MTGGISIEPAQPNELTTVLELLDEAAGWLQKRGIDQWPRSFSQDATWRIDRIRSYVEHGMTYLARDGMGQAIATFTLSRAADPQFAHGWPDGPGNAGYVFRMAVARHAAGRDVGGHLLDWAARESARWGMAWLRIDVHRYNQDLQEYYRRHGFAKVGEVTAPDLTVNGRTRGSGTLMQRPTSEGSAMAARDYDPDGAAAIWLEASNYIRDMQLENPPRSETAWNDALDQAARALELQASEIRQASGMYYRAMSGQPVGTKENGDTNLH